MSVVRTGIVLAAAAAALAAGPVPAATDPLKPPDVSRYLRWGPVRVRPSVVLSGIGYDDNVFYLSEDQPAEGDWTATVSPRVEGLVLFGHRAFLTFKEQVDGVLYAKHTDISYLDQRGTARLTVPFARMGVFVEGTLNRIHERTTSESDARPQRNESRGIAGIVLPLGWRSHVELSRTLADWTYHDDPFGCAGTACVTVGTELDRRETGTELKARYLLRGRTAATFDASDREIAFDTQTDRDSHERRFLPGIELGTGGSIVGRLRAGAAHLDSLDPEKPDFRDWIGNLETTWSPAGRTRITLNGRRDVSFAAWSNNQFHVNWQAEARGVHWITRAIGLEAAALRGRLRFSDPPASPADPRRFDRVTQVEGGVRLRTAENSLGRRIEYSFLVRRFQRESTLPGIDQSRTSVGFGAVLGY